MDKFSEQQLQKLADKGFISEAQYQEVKDHKALGLFSLNTELLFLVYLSVLLFTTGIGTLVYKNIDSIGHIAILAVNLVLTWRIEDETQIDFDTGGCSRFRSQAEHPVCVVACGLWEGRVGTWAAHR